MTGLLPRLVLSLDPYMRCKQIGIDWIQIRSAVILKLLQHKCPRNWSSSTMVHHHGSRKDICVNNTGM